MAAEEVVPLSNNEFRELIPNLQLEDVFLVEIKNPVWMIMFESVFQNYRELIRCNLCRDRPDIEMKDFKIHLTDQNHINALAHVDRFYHPIYTYPKDFASKTTLGRDLNMAQIDSAKRLASLVEKHSTQKVVRLQLNDVMDIVCYTERNRFPLISHGRSAPLRCVLCDKLIFKDINAHFQDKNHAENISRLKGLSLDNNPEVTKYVLIQVDDESENQEFEDVLRHILLQEKPESPHLMHLQFEMPFEELYKLEFFDGRAWRPMLGKVPNQPSLIKCFLCNKTCTNGNIQPHLMGKQHKKLQLQQQNLRHQTNKKITKYASFAVGPEFKINVSLQGRKKYRSKAELELSKQSEGPSPVFSNVDDTSDFGKHRKPSTGVVERATALQSVMTSKNRIDEEKQKSPVRKPKLDISPDEALIGVEYVVRLVKPEPILSKPMYECCLCEYLSNENLMQDHLTSYNHRYKYCELHYSDALKKYSSLFPDVRRYDLYRVMGPILAKIAFGIEEYHGRSFPRTVIAADFKKNRPEIIAELYCAKHACQLYGPSFTNVLNDEEVQKLKAGMNIYQPEKKRLMNAPNRFTIFPPGLTYCKGKVRVDKMDCEVTAERSVRIEPRRRSRSRSPNANNTLDLGAKAHEGRQVKRSFDEYEDPKKELWRQYRQQVMISTSEVERAYVDYRNNPESHPQYDQEWNQFWRQRKAELNSQGIDHRSYNFQPEWVNYFKQRIEQLFSEAVQQAKMNVRKRLNIAMDAEEISEQEIFPENVRVQNPHLNSDDRERRHTAPEDKNFKRDFMVDQMPQPAQKKHRVDTDNLVMQWNSQPRNQKYQDSGIANMKPKNRELSSSKNEGSAEKKTDIIHALRLMAAFEDYLGSLGPKVTELLFTALSLDKSLQLNTQQLQQKLLTPNNCSLLETSMEKLRGILLAGLLENSKHPGFNQVIKCTEDLLDHAEKMGYRQQPVASVGKQQSVNQNFQRFNEADFQQSVHVRDTDVIEIQSDEDDKPGEFGNRNYGSYEPFSNKSFTRPRNAESYQRPGFQNDNALFSRNLNKTNLLNTESRSRLGRTNADVPQRFSREEEKNNQRYEGLATNRAECSDFAVVERNNFNNSNLGNNYRKLGYSGERNLSGGFMDSWKTKPTNAGPGPKVNSGRKEQQVMFGGVMSALEHENMQNQLQILRQRQANRYGRQN